MSLIQELRAAWALHQDAAERAYSLYVDMCGGRAPPRVPGCDTVLRIAHRIYHGRSEQEAAAKEYLYRWGLAVDRASVFGAPHAIGM